MAKPASYLNWTIDSVLSESLQLERKVATNVVKMLEDGNTVPFIARYRKERTRNMEAKQLHAVKEKFDELRELEERILKLKTKVEKMGELNEVVDKALRNCKSEEQLTFISEPFKARTSRSMAQRARDKGLEPLALKLIKEPHLVDIVEDVPPSIRSEGPDAIEEDVCYILADVVAKDVEVLQRMDELLKRRPPVLECKRTKTSAKNEKVAAEEAAKFTTYFDFRRPTAQLKSFQVLAINRAEAKKLLSVKLEPPSNLEEDFFNFCRRKFRTSATFHKVLERAMKDAYSRLLLPHLTRSIRSRLRKQAFLESLELFSDNLRQLLMTSPVRGEPILGVDPGFSQGCKLALIGSGGEVMETGKIFLSRRNEARDQLVHLLKKTRCQLVAIGDGVGSREFETLMSELLQSGRLAPLNVRYCITSECGASIYSASGLAEQELGWMDITFRGAVSIARRLQDPLSELVKIPPGNLGVGQYQHDLPERQLAQRLSSILQECISLVGVDLNYAPVHVLQHVAGLNKTRATAIFDHRRLNGDFLCREDLLKIRGIGKAVFKQCAGFVRIFPPEVKAVQVEQQDSDVEMVPVEELPTKVPSVSGRGTKRKRDTPAEAVVRKKGPGTAVREPLDSTTVHPESYDLARSLIAALGFETSDILSPALRQAAKVARESRSLRHFARQGEEEGGLQTVLDVLQALEQPSHFDPRADLFKPLFRCGLQSIEALSVGCPVSGRVTNVTQFGAFVDIGVGRDALIHTSQWRGLKIELGTRLTAVVQNLDLKTKRIGLTTPRLLR